MHKLFLVLTCLVSSSYLRRVQKESVLQDERGRQPVGALAIMLLAAKPSLTSRLGRRSLPNANRRPAAQALSKKICGRCSDPAMIAMLNSSAKECVFLGIDFGTSGARATTINQQGEILHESRQSYPDSGSEGLLEAWRHTLYALIHDIPDDIRRRIVTIALDGTSSTALLLERKTGCALTTPLMYDHKCPDAVPIVENIAPVGHTVVSSTSTLCKLVSWNNEGLLKGNGEELLMHQCDWLSYLLHGIEGATDYNNALKLGYDPDPSLGNGEGGYPSWLTEQPFASALPELVYPPGKPIAHVQQNVASTLGLPLTAQVCAGTTDSIAAFLAAEPSQIGQAVTSLGSTLAIKLLSGTRVDDARYGIYSHRLGDLWLVGGASNTGGAVLREHFSDSRLKELSAQINADVESKLDYYPLSSPGERFPENNPDLQPRLEPRPESDVEYLHGMLESIAKIEARGFSLINSMGASDLQEVFTAGGGAQNSAWTEIRSRVLGVPVTSAEHVEASYGSALLARTGYSYTLDVK